MGKIDDYIAEHKIKPSDALYHTNRTVDGTGKIRVLATKDNVAHVEYKCPKCTNEDYTESEWKRPFSVKCSKCGGTIKVPKLKQQFKREQKKANAESK
jgi:ribosomal protein S27E